MGQYKLTYLIEMSEIKLTYFNIQARAETARLILAHAGVRYTDQRLTFPEFGSVKPNLPYGQLPILKYNGELLCQSMTIARFLASEFGLAGRNDVEKSQADEIVDAINDLFDGRRALLKETDEDKKSVMRSKLLNETLPTGLAQLEARLVERGGQYFVGNNLTWADLHLHCLVNILRKNHAELLDGCPCIKNLIERIEELPNISKWLISRPETEIDVAIATI